MPKYIINGQVAVTCIVDFKRSWIYFSIVLAYVYEWFFNENMNQSMSSVSRMSGSIVSQTNHYLQHHSIRDYACIRTCTHDILCKFFRI